MTYLTYNVKAYFDKITDTRKKSVLDFGCNHANFLLNNNSPCKYTGLDINKDIVAQNKELFPRRKWIHYPHYNWQYNCKFLQSSKWPLKHSYDIIVAFSVFTHTDFSEFKTTFERLKKHLNPGGRILPTFISTKNAAYLKTIFEHRKEYFNGHDLIDEIQSCNTVTIAVNTKSKQIHLLKNMLEIPRFSNETYFLTFYNDEWLASNLNAEVIDVTEHFEGILGVQKCISYIHP
jgi:SAM-dependent methyltransferase